MKKMLQKKKNDTVSDAVKSTSLSYQDMLKRNSWLLICLLLFFSLCLVLITDTLSRNLRNKEADINETLHQYLSSSFSSNIDSLYTYSINQPMEEFFDSAAVTSFLFCTPQYPPSEEFKNYLQDRLSALVANSDFITASAVYSVSSDTYVASQRPDQEQDEESSSFWDDLIYDYNSNTLDKNKISGNKYNTFLFKYQDYIVFAKNLTTLSGSSHATIFMLLDKDDFSSFIYRANGMIPYGVNVYDSHNEVLFSNAKHASKTIYTQLLSLESDGFASQQVNNISYLYCRSDITGLQYLIEMYLIALPETKSDSWLIYLLLFLISLAAVGLVSFICFFRFRRSAAQLVSVLDSLELKVDKPSDLTAVLSQKAEQLLYENASFKKIIHATSSEAISHLFAKLISGEPVEKEEAKITLTNTGYNFHLDDIYTAGILHQTIPDFIKASSRYRILNMLNSIFDKFKEKNECNLCAFLLDEKSFVVIASFPSGTSIAKGKAKINELTALIKEGVTLLQLPMTVSFGHMYNSILDLSFSYNEAFRAMHYTLEAASSVQSLHNTDISAVQFPLAAAESASASSAEAIVDEENEISDIPDVPDLSEQLDRRASQIAQLIWDDKETQLPSLIERTLLDIFESKTYEEQEENSRRLISAVIGHMISYPFVNDSNLSNVYDSLSTKIQEGLRTDELLQEVQEDLDILCSDFSKVVQKQRNPYILAAQEYISANYQNPDLSLEGIAENLKLAPNYLSTIFSKNLGIKLFEYITEYRLEKSIELLLHSNKTVNDISTECGFGSSRNYIRVFKKYKDTTPGVYRKQHMTVQTPSQQN